MLSIQIIALKYRKSPLFSFKNQKKYKKRRKKSKMGIAIEKKVCYNNYVRIRKNRLRCPALAFFGIFCQ